jgi:hypothetical protein
MSVVGVIRGGWRVVVVGVGQFVWECLRRTEDGEVVIVIVIRRKADAEYRCALSSPSHVDRGE